MDIYWIKCSTFLVKIFKLKHSNFGLSDKNPTYLSKWSFFISLLRAEMEYPLTSRRGCWFKTKDTNRTNGTGEEEQEDRHTNTALFILLSFCCCLSVSCCSICQLSTSAFMFIAVFNRWTSKRKC